MSAKPRPIYAKSLPHVDDKQCQNGVWFLPSRNRPDRASACMDACSDAGQETPGILIQDGCRYSYARRAETVTGTPLHPGLPRYWSAISTPEHRELAGALTFGWKAFPDLDWYGIISDGIRPKTIGWDRLIIAASRGRNFVSCDDGWRRDARMAGILLVPGWIVRAMGYWFPAGMVHLWTDNVWEDLGEALGNWNYAVDVKVEDHHHSHPDPARRTVFDHPRTFTGHPEGYSQNDARLFAEWRNGPEFGLCVDRIKASWKEMTGSDWDRKAA